MIYGLLDHPGLHSAKLESLGCIWYGAAPMSPARLAEALPGSAEELAGFVKERLGSVKAPKQVEIWPGLPRSKLGKILKNEVRNQLLHG
ncbi:hypothetical protein [Sciscionella sediminilitoris]|uniref:hypothetical protein n=1 Tax=Sciscionella sediminilitoris TaxID=1445613 RepID=UPI0004DED88B|nr:hypothetical protein [Sciscionella sp. SE31]